MKLMAKTCWLFVLGHPMPSASCKLLPEFTREML